MAAAEKAGNPGDLNMASTLPLSEIILQPNQRAFFCFGLTSKIVNFPLLKFVYTDLCPVQAHRAE